MLLKVVDSAGSFSELKVGKRTYATFVIFDALPQLEKVEGENSLWFRHDDKKKTAFPSEAPLSDMRCFIRLYRKRQ